MKRFRAKKNNAASDTEMKHGEEVSSCITYEAGCQEYFGIKVVQESQVSILWNCGLWAHLVVLK